MNQFEIAADALADVARAEAKTVADHAVVRMSMMAAASAKMTASGFFPDGVPFVPLAAMVDGIFETFATHAQKVFGNRLKGAEIDPGIIIINEADGVRHAERAAEFAIAHLQRKRAEVAASRQALQPGQQIAAQSIEGIMQNIQHRERGFGDIENAPPAEPQPLMSAAEIAARIDDRERVSKRDYPAKAAKKDKR